MPQITVLMAVKNGEKYIQEAIDSILAQTFGDFELLIMDDGSTDNTVNLIHTYRDKRISLIQQKPDYIANLNKGLSLAKGKYIARMDADDIMHSERLRVQNKRMDENPHITICSSWMRNFNAENRTEILCSLEDEIENPLLALLKGNFIYHPTVMIRQDFLVKHQLSYQNYTCAEDYKLWADIALHNGIFYVEPQALTFHRQTTEQVSKTKQKEMRRYAMRVKEEITDYLLQSWQPPEKQKQLMQLKDILMDLEKDSFLKPEEVATLLFHLFSRCLYPQAI